MERVLFEPFKLSKWLGLGFCALLAGLPSLGGLGGSGAINPSFRGTFDHGEASEGGIPEPSVLFEWIQEFPLRALLLLLAISGIVVATAALLTWISSRGRFLFLDGVVRNRAAIIAPWHEYRREGNSLFRLRFLLGAAMVAAILIVVACGLGIAWLDLANSRFGWLSILALLMGILSLGPMVVLGFVLRILLMDFLVPIMYLRRVSVVTAWREFRGSLLRGNTRRLILYVLMRALLLMIIHLAAGVIALFTCLLVLVPYVGSVLLLPLSIFEVAYPLYFIEQYGDGWRLIAPEREG
jgi:hypothetical protein